MGYKSKCKILSHVEILELFSFCVDTEVVALVVGMKWVLSKNKNTKKLKQKIIMKRENDKMEINIKQRTRSILFIVVL